MGLSFRGLVALAALGVGALATAQPASAITYSASYMISPSSLSCEAFGKTDICNYSVPINSLVTLNAGDVLDLSVTYTSPLNVPGSKSYDLVYIGVVDDQFVDGPAQAGPTPVEIYTSTVSGYAGPAGPILASTTTSDLDSYFGGAGFCCGYGEPNGGFSLTTLQSTITITVGDPNPLSSVDFGYQVNVPEPASWALMLVGFAGLGAALRVRRRVVTAAA